MIQLDLNALFQSAFGYVAMPYPQGEFAFNPVAGLENIQKNDILGRPVPMPVALNSYTLPNAVIEIAGKKSIQETPLAGNKERGTVKELISVNDYKVNIKGIIVNQESDNFPGGDVSTLYELHELSEPVTIECPVTDLFFINQVVIKKIRLPEINGTHAQAYEIEAISDEDFTAELLNE